MSNFERLKAVFLKETGKAWDNDLSVYVAYYQAKIIEDFVQGYYTKNNILKK